MKVLPEKKVTVVVPTYNEAANIRELLREIMRVSENIAGYELNILVVDDNSPDGTAELVRELGMENVYLLERERKEGLGRAYIDGFGYAIRELGSDVVLEMDADFSHDPGDLPRFLAELGNGFDLVLGSRHIVGGSIPGWGVHRRLLSYTGNLLAREILGLQVSDCTSGYRAIKTSLLEEINLEEINVKGYAFQLSLLHSAVAHGARIKEIPIVFHRRRAGESKLGLGDISEFLAELVKRK
ncbi:MAG: dolichyl-phosphate beta-D-mannosyltransferase [Candidatus Altiarchaeales archaeon ex4484_2]|nr:MAG: dolichyl-phosphate beta-D-mannosyltransferase [Candidatus Altiarchaeales archaeon ex4484_2]